MSDRIKDMEGTPVSEEEVAKEFGYTLEQFRQWTAEGGPTGRCSNGDCWRPAFWPNLDKPCQYCGSPIKLDKR